MWETLKKINRILNEAESLLGEKFISRYVSKIGQIDGNFVTVIIADRGNWFDVATVTFNLNTEPSQVAEELRRVIKL
jgi:hypothetical protein